MPEKPGVHNPPSIEVQDEGVVVGHVRRIDFVGGSVEASLNADTVVVTVPTAGSGIGTHSFLDAYHFHPNAAPSGNILTAIGSANVPTYAPPAGGMATHSFGGAWHDVDTWANFASRLSDGVPIKVGDSVASLGLWAGHIGSVDAHYSHAGHAGSLGAHVVWPIVVASISGFAGHVGSVGAHHVKYTDVQAQAIADTQVSIHAALVGIHHSPTHNIGGADHNPDTWANLLTKISNAVALKVGDSVASLTGWAGHIGSQAGHWGLDAGIPSGYALQAIASGGVPTWGVQAGGAGGTHAFLGHTFGAGASGALLSAMGSGSVPSFSSVWKAQTANIADDAITAAKIDPTAAWGVSGKKLSNFVNYSADHYVIGIFVASDSSFVAKIDGAPSGAAVVYDTVTGNEDSIKPGLSTYIGKLVLHNTTRSDSALIGEVDTATNTITLTAAAPGGWSDNDDIQVNSLTALSGLSRYYFDLDMSGFLPATAIAVLMELTVSDSGGGNQSGRLHPFEAIGGDWFSKSTLQRTQVAVISNFRELILKVVDQKICMIWDASGSGTFTIALRCFGWWEDSAL